MTVRALLALIAGVALVGSAEAQPLPEGLPAVAARVTALEHATNTLQGQISTVQGQVGTLQGQVSTLQTLVGTLQGQVSTLQSQVTTLQNSNSSLQSALDQEIANREAGDGALQGAITAASSKGFSTYNDKADLVEGAEATVGTIGPLPAGSYAVVATANLLNADHGATWRCLLRRDDTNAVIGKARADTESVGITGNSVSQVIVTIPALVTLPDNGGLHMTCNSGEAGSTIHHIQIVATSVGTATVGSPILDPCC